MPSMESGRAWPSAADAKEDVSGTNATSIALAKGFQGLAGAVEKVADEHVQQEDALDLIRANAEHSRRLHEIQNEFDTDPDWKTYKPRFADRATQSTADAAAAIRNPKLRTRWVEQAAERNITYGDRVNDRATRLQKEDKEIEVGRNLETYRSLYVGARDDGERQRLLGDIDATVTAGVRTGLVDRSKAEAMRTRAINDALREDVERRMLSGDAIGAMRDLGALPRDRAAAPPSSGTTSQSGIDLIKRLEGSSDNGWDIRQFSGPYGVKRAPNERLTLEQAEQRLLAETGQVDGWIQKNVKVPLTQEQHDALVSFGYNQGTGAIQKLLPDINAGNHEKVGERMLSFNKAENKDGQLEPLAGLTARRREEAAMYLGTAPTGRYARMSFADRHALVTRAKVSMSAETQQDLKDAYQEVVDGGSLPTDDKGMTALDRARLFLQPNQIKRAELQFEEARMMHDAVAPLRDMTDRQVMDHLNRIRDPKATGDRAALARKVGQAAEKAWTEIEAERLSDPVEAIDPYTNVRTQRAGKTRRADEVTGAYDMIKRRYPSLETRQSASGALEIVEPDNSEDPRWPEIHRARRALIDARIEAQSRLNIPPASRSPISQREARELLQLPEDLGAMQRGDLVMRLRDAGDRAEIKYGKEMGPIVFQAALRYHTSGTAELKEAKTMAINRLLSGAEVKRSDIKRLEDLQQLERRRGLFNAPSPEEGRAPRPDLPPVERPAPKPSGGGWWPFGGGSTPAPKAAQPAERPAPTRSQRGSVQKAPANPFDEVD